MKIATYNIQNLFHRDTSLLKLNEEHKSKIWKEEFENIHFKNKKTLSDYNRMRELAELLGFSKATYEPYLSMKNMDGRLHVRTSMRVMETRASYLTNWNGWTKLKSIPISNQAVLNKAKVLLNVDADILLLQEVENKQSLIQFANSFFGTTQKSPYSEIAHFQGNDDTGLGMGILLKKGYEIKSMKSYSNERNKKGELIFKRDFLKIKIKTPEKETLYVLGCHFTGESEDNNIISNQVKKVTEVYHELSLKGAKNIAIMGTLNTPSYSSSLNPIMKLGVQDISKHTSFSVVSDSGKDAGYYRMGAYQMGVNIKQKDYLLTSPSLFENIIESGLNRKALWPLKEPQWETYASMKNESDAASDHPLLWADFRKQERLKVFKRSA